VNREEELAFAGVAGQAARLADGSVTSVGLLDTLLGRIERLDPELGAFRVLLPDEARAAAAAADTARAAGDPRPLLGVAVAVKDNVDLAGVPTRHGTGSPQRPAATDGPTVRRLRDAGLVIVGKTNLPELALWAVTASPWQPVTRNPWRTDRTPGGSSGGSAAAVAAGLVAAAHATDGLGSIRIPAAWSGLFGLKPSRGVVAHDEPDHWHGLSHSGFLTRTVLDTALLLDATGSGPGFVAGLSSGPRLRVGWTDRPPTPGVGVHPEIREALSATVRALVECGHDVRPVRLPRAEILHVLLPRYLRGAADDLALLVDPARTQARTRAMARAGRRVPARLLRGARRSGDRIGERLAATTFSEVDVLIQPSTAQLPIRADAFTGRGALLTLGGFGRSVPFTQLWNITGQPAASLPAAVSRAGLPIGIQLVGRRGEDRLLLTLAAELETHLGWSGRYPPMAVSAP